ncbi:MAG: hypothetical protein ACRC2Y_13170 [Aeromonas veronii]
MAILNDGSASSTGLATSAQYAQVEQKTTVSRTMLARLRLNSHLVAEAKEELAKELVNIPTIDPQEMLNKIIQVRETSKQIDLLAATYANAQEAPMTPQDVQTMKEIANVHGQKVAGNCFGISQPAVSDYLTGKTKPAK